MTLRELLDAACPGPWATEDRPGAITLTVQNDDEDVICDAFPRDARLIALAPEMAGLLLDMADALGAILNHEERYSFDEIEALLARLDRIGQ